MRRFRLELLAAILSAVCWSVESCETTQQQVDELIRTVKRSALGQARALLVDLIITAYIPRAGPAPDRRTAALMRR